MLQGDTEIYSKLAANISDAMTKATLNVVQKMYIGNNKNVNSVVGNIYSEFSAAERNNFNITFTFHFMRITFTKALQGRAYVRSCLLFPPHSWEEYSLFSSCTEKVNCAVLTDPSFSVLIAESKLKEQVSGKNYLFT